MTPRYSSTVVECPLVDGLFVACEFSVLFFSRDLIDIALIVLLLFTTTYDQLTSLRPHVAHDGSRYQHLRHVPRPSTLL